MGFFLIGSELVVANCFTLNFPTSYILSRTMEKKNLYSVEGNEIIKNLLR